MKLENEMPVSLYTEFTKKVWQFCYTFSAISWSIAGPLLYFLLATFLILIDIRFPFFIIKTSKTKITGIAAKYGKYGAKLTNIDLKELMLAVNANPLINWNI